MTIPPIYRASHVVDCARSSSVLEVFGSFVEFVKLDTNRSAARELAPRLDLRSLTRDEMKALPCSVIAAPFGGYGSLTVLDTRDTPFTRILWSRKVELSRIWRAVGEDPIKAPLVERYLRLVWAKLVDRADGYFLQHLGRQRFA